MTRPEASVCSLEADLPDCGTGPAGRLGFVLREARAAWRRRGGRGYTHQRPPVCGMTVGPARPGASALAAGRRYVFCSQGWADAFTTDPARHLSDGELSAPTATR